MFGCRTGLGVGCCALALGFVLACGGSTTHSGPSGEGGDGADGPTNTSGKASFGGNSNTAGVQGRSGNAGTKPIDDPDPVNTACPEEDLPPPSLQCDPYVQGDCGAGAGCYPFVEHPEGKGCDAQIYGTICQPAGLGTQGQRCGDDTGDRCGPGFVCVVGQRAGKRCAALCKPGSTDQCSGGLICGDLDVSGFGVCG